MGLDNREKIVGIADMKTTKYFRCFFIFLFSLVFFFFSSNHLCAAKRSSQKTTSSAKKSYSVSASSGILLNSTRGKRLYSKNSNQKVPPASTTKVMTALLVMERMSLDAVITVPSTSAINVQPSKIDVSPGEKYRVADLLYALLVNSANDVSVVLAMAVSGSEKKFVNLMNERARQLGAKNTHFVNSHGLPSSKSKQYTTAYDMSLIFKAALKHSFFKTAINIQSKTIHSQSGRKISLRNHNKMLFTKWGDNIYGKTGYTKAAKACFVGYTAKGKDSLIIAVFGCSRRWDDIKHIMRRYGGIPL